MGVSKPNGSEIGVFGSRKEEDQGDFVHGERREEGHLLVCVSDL